MISTAIEKEWYAKKKKLKYAYVFLENNDLDYKVAEKQIMLDRLRLVIGISKEEMQKVYELI